MTFELKGTHPFVGVGIMGGPSQAFSGQTGKLSGSADGSFLFSIRGGIYAGRNEIALEISPMTYIAHTKLPGPQFQMAFNFTGFVPLYESPTFDVYWPFRVGYGFVAANMSTLPSQNAVFMQLRLDVFGVGFRIGHLMLDFNFPDFRYLYSPGDATGNAMFFTWLPGVQASYVF